MTGFLKMANEGLNVMDRLTLMKGKGYDNMETLIEFSYNLLLRFDPQCRGTATDRKFCK